MRKTLATVAATAAAFALPFLATGTSYAATSLSLPNVGDSVSVSAVDANALLQQILVGGGCTTTYAFDLLGLGTGNIVTISGLKVTEDIGAAITYTFAVDGVTVKLVNCLV